jgi:hypothetical protein
MNASTRKPKVPPSKQSAGPPSIPTRAPAPATLATPLAASPRGKVSVYIGDRVALAIWTVCALVLAGLLLKDLIQALLSLL